MKKTQNKHLIYKRDDLRLTHHVKMIASGMEKYSRIYSLKYSSIHFSEMFYTDGYLN